MIVAQPLFQILFDVESTRRFPLDRFGFGVARRCIVSHEAPVTSGFGAEIAATISARCFTALEAPVERVRDGCIPQNTPGGMQTSLKTP